MDEFGSINVDASQTSDTARERIKYGLSSWSSGGGSGVNEARGVGAMR